MLFETGYGPSGLPHIGTFGEVARTSMVRHAFQAVSDIPTRLISFSDDMDGLRKVPDNLPNPEMIAANLGKPLTSIPDPFLGCCESFGHHMNAKLREFLDHFGFEYEFKSSTATYKAGEFDKTLLKILAKYQEVMDLMLPTLGEERQQTYSPFLPVSPRSGKVLLAKVVMDTMWRPRNHYLSSRKTVRRRNRAGDPGQMQDAVEAGHMGMRWVRFGR